jgi:predicted outer membrane repeat protein
MTKPTVAILPSIHALAGNTSAVAGGAIFSARCIAVMIMIAMQVLLATMTSNSSQHRMWSVFYQTHSGMN